MAGVTAGVMATVVSLAPAPAAATAGAACGPVITDGLAEPPWPQARLRPDLAWPLSTGAGVTVAVIDSGVSADHPSLSGKVLPGNDLVAPGKGDCDENGHGTLIAGIIAGRETTSNGFPFHGVAPDAKIVPVRILRDQRRTFDDQMPGRIASAIRWAVDSGGAQVINLSLSTLDAPELASAVAHAVNRRVVVVAAAGNEGAAQAGAPVYPAAYDGVIAVAGVDREDKHVGSSVTGPYVDIAAPGARITGPAPAGGGYVFSEAGGTSFAAAYVSGVAALIRAYDPGLTPQQVAQRITETADHPAEIWNASLGYGVINPQRAVGALRAARSPAALPVRRVEVPAPPADPLRGVKILAAWVTGVGIALAALLLIAVGAMRKGRRRGWRPSRTTPGSSIPD